jgi:hypothetical protein
MFSVQQCRGSGLVTGCRRSRPGTTSDVGASILRRKKLFIIFVDALFTSLLKALFTKPSGDGLRVTVPPCVCPAGIAD